MVKFIFIAVILLVFNGCATNTDNLGNDIARMINNR